MCSFFTNTLTIHESYIGPRRFTIPNQLKISITLAISSTCRQGKSLCYGRNKARLVLKSERWKEVEATH